jgi:hypothetical protein
LLTSSGSSRVARYQKSIPKITILVYFERPWCGVILLWYIFVIAKMWPIFTKMSKNTKKKQLKYILKGLF